MKHLYNSNIVLQTDTLVRVQANYNKTIFGMTRPGDVLFYQAPSDPAEHPMYVDAEGRIVPVSPVTLQPMQIGGKVVDSDGVEMPDYKDIAGSPHIDDVRVAVTSGDFEVKDEKGDDIYIAHDGEIIPTNDFGIPNTTLVGGVVWVIGKDGQPHAPLSRVYTLRSYVNPVRAENYPIFKNGSRAPVLDEAYPEYFDIEAIVKADRPARRGALIAWATADAYDTPTISGLHGYDGPRFYTAGEEMQYTYWTSPTTSDAAGTTSGSTLYTFDDSWAVAGGTNRVVSAGMVSADFGSTNFTRKTAYFSKFMNLTDDGSYEVSFDVLAQGQALITVELEQWAANESSTDAENASTRLRTRILQSKVVAAGTSENFNIDVIPSAGTQLHQIRVYVQRGSVKSGQYKVSLSNLSFKSVVYPIAGVGPRAIYDRPVEANRIVIGVDYSVDESNVGDDSYTNRPADSDVRAYVDRGDGLFEWEIIATNPEIDEDGKINLFFDGTVWGDAQVHTATAKIMGIQYNVYGMKRRDARVNLMEISAWRTYDVTDRLYNYTVESDAAETSFVLPFGTVNANYGTLELSNNDGAFNHENRYLLDVERTAVLGEDVFTDEVNPFWRMLGESIYVEVDTATFVPGDEDRQYLRMITAQTEDDIDPGANMIASMTIRDDSRILSRITPEQTFYSGPSMSVIQVLYMLLDSVGFTNVTFADEDEHFATHLKYFWTSKENDNLWEVISDLCQATQTVAFFDEYNVLNFKSLRGMYEDALAKAPAQVFTSETLPGIYSNISSVTLEDRVSVNKLNINYRETSEPEKTPSGSTPMSVVWEPDGTQVVRGAYIMNDINDLLPGRGGSTFFQIQGKAAKTWPFEGLVEVEGERIKYEGKQYTYHLSNGSTATKYIKNDDERKELDKNNEYLAMNNSYTGRLKIIERGVEETAVKKHLQNDLDEFTRRYYSGTGSVVEGLTAGLSIKNSRLFINQNRGSGNGITSVSEGHVNDYRPYHMGTRFRINSGTHAGVCFGLSSPNDDGIFVEVTTTEANEAAGRPRGELHIFTRKAGVIKMYGAGVDVPISRYKDYDLDVSVKDGSLTTAVTSYAKYYPVVLRYGNVGANVAALQAALNRQGEKLAVDKSFGPATRNAVLRLQKRNSLTQDAVVRIEEWRALEVGGVDVNTLTIHAVIDGTYSVSVQIPKSQLPSGYIGGRHGVFTRGKTAASFEYIYAIRGSEDVEFDESNFFDYIYGGYVSDQLDAGWLFDTKLRWVGGGSAKVKRKVRNNQLLMIDFGPYAHEIKDYDVVFNDEEPALSSYLYYSNEADVHLTDYKHSAFGAKFRLVNKARYDAVVNGEDAVTFGPDDAVDQRMMVYGTVLKVDDERAVTVSNKNSIAARGVEEMTIDVDWIQSEESANKLGSHVIEAMSHPVPTYSLDIFGHAGMRVGQIVSIYDPKRGIGDVESPEDSNRYFVHTVNHSNNGTHSTTLGVREVIGSSGPRSARLKDVLAANNNAMNINPDIEKYFWAHGTGVYHPKGYSFRDGIIPNFVSPKSPTQSGGGAVRLRATGETPYQSTMFANPYPDEEGRFAHTYGDYFILTASVTGVNTVGAGLVIEGWPTTGNMTKILASKSITVKPGETKRITLKGRFLSDASIPELEVGVRVLNPKNHSQGATIGTRLLVNDFYYRSSQNEEDIYPLHGGAALRKI